SGPGPRPVAGPGTRRAGSWPRWERPWGAKPGATACSCRSFVFLAQTWILECTARPGRHLALAVVDLAFAEGERAGAMEAMALGADLLPVGGPHEARLEFHRQHARHVRAAYGDLERSRGHRQRDVQHGQDEAAMGHAVGIEVMRPHHQREMRVPDLRLVHAQVEPVEERDLERKALRIDCHEPAQKTSNRPAAPMPPPTHIVTTASFAPRRLPSMRAWPVRRWPLTP